MRYPSPGFYLLLEVFNFDSKRSLERHCRNIVVHRQDMTALILAAQAGDLGPYRYANFFDRRLPENLNPTEEEIQSFASNGVGPLRNSGAQKFAKKIFQLFKVQRSLAIHLFYTPDHQHWYLFYFDNRDKAEHGNHWQHGAHIHLVCSLWTNLVLDTVWSQAKSGKLSFPSIYLRFRGSGLP